MLFGFTVLMLRLLCMPDGLQGAAVTLVLIGYIVVCLVFVVNVG